MNLESAPSKKTQVSVQADDSLFDEIDFKPITSGLGFHQPSPSETRPVFTERTIPTPTPVSTSRKETPVYQNDLSIFYGHAQTATLPQQEAVEEKRAAVTYRTAPRSQRVFAYLCDLLLVGSVVALVMTIMARTIRMDLVEAWTAYPNEITPLVITMFTGIYLIYFSIFEKSVASTLGKSIFGLKVVNEEDGQQTFNVLMLRSIITLLNFLSLGLFAYFDLQNKVTNSKIVRKS